MYILEFTCTWHPMCIFMLQGLCPLSELPVSANCASNCISKHTWLQPPIVSLSIPNHSLLTAFLQLLNSSLKVYLYIYYISASKYITKLIQSWPSSVSLSEINNSLQCIFLDLYHHIHQVYISQLSHLPLPSISAPSVHHALQVQLLVLLLAVSKLIQLWLLRISQSTLNCCLHVLLWVYLSTVHSQINHIYIFQ